MFISIDRFSIDEVSFVSDRFESEEISMNEFTGETIQDEIDTLMAQFQKMEESGTGKI